MSPKKKLIEVALPLDPTRVGRDASRIADEIIAHLAGFEIPARRARFKASPFSLWAFIQMA